MKNGLAALAVGAIIAITSLGAPSAKAQDLGVAEWSGIAAAAAVAILTIVGSEDDSVSTTTTTTSTSP